MKTWYTFYHLMRADFLERVRSYHYLVTLGLTVFLGYIFLPPLDAPYVTVDLGGYRGIYNSAWVSTVVALMSTLFLSLVGFYVVKNVIKRDEKTGVGQIIATTPISKSTYMIGKWFSNVAVLSSMVLIIAIMAGLMQIVRGEVLEINPAALFTPFILLILPLMLVVAAVALLFESIKWLRGGLGNVVYFFAVLIGLDVVDRFIGIEFVLSEMLQSVKTVFPDHERGYSIGFVPKAALEFLSGKPYTLQTFLWEGVDWPLEFILGRFGFIIVALGITLIAAFIFNRFDSALEIPKKLKRVIPVSDKPQDKMDVSPIAHHALSELPADRLKFSFIYLLSTQLRLMLKGVAWWWYVIMIILMLVGLVAPIDIGKAYILPFIWIWPLLIWSGMGSRENRYNTTQLIFSVAYPLRRQLFVTWLAGIFITLIAGSTIGIRLLVAGYWFNLIAWLVCILFVPSLALALGIWSGSSKLFEVVYLLLWYSGPMNNFAPLDYMGVTDEAIKEGVYLFYLLGTVILLALAIFRRQQQLQT